MESQNNNAQEEVAITEEFKKGTLGAAFKALTSHGKYILEKHKNKKVTSGWPAEVAKARETGQIVNK